MKNKLVGWKANLLSLVGRTVLIQASSSAIPTYVMQCVQLPVRILDGIDQVNWNFLRGSSKASKKVHWVGWHKVVKSKEEGGLRLQAAKGRNNSLLAKLNWRFHTKKDTLWSQVLRQKYCNNRRVNASNVNRLPYSPIWRAMKRGMDTFNKGAMWMIGRDSTLNFWLDSWMVQGPLRHLIQGPLTREATQLKVRDVLTDAGWQWGLIPFELLSDLKSLIQAILVSAVSRGSDKLAWTGNPRGSFDLKSAYSISMADDNSPRINLGWVWKIETLTRIKSFIWQCAHNSVKVKGCLVKKGMGGDD